MRPATLGRTHVRELGCGAERDLSPGGDEVRHQDAPRDTVDHEVVCDHDEAARHVAAEVDPDETQHVAGARIEVAHRQIDGLRCRGHDVLGLGLRVDHDVVDRGVEVHGAGLGNLETPPLVVMHESCAQAVVTVDDFGDRAEYAAAVDADGQVEGHRLHEAVEGSAALDHRLRERCQRHTPDAAAGELLEHDPVGGVALGCRYRSEERNCLLLEHISWCDDHATSTRTGNQLDGDDAVAAESEERVVDAYSIDAEHLGEDLAENLLDVAVRAAEVGRAFEDGFGQCFSIQLARGSEWKCVEYQNHCRHHVFGHERGHVPQ